MISNLDILFLAPNFGIRQIWRGGRGDDFKYHHIVFKSSLKNTQVRHFWSEIEAFVLFSEILQIEKFEGDDFKYGNSFFIIVPKKILNQAFLVKTTGIRHC